MGTCWFSALTQHLCPWIVELTAGQGGSAVTSLFGFPWRVTFTVTLLLAARTLTDTHGVCVLAPDPTLPLWSCPFLYTCCLYGRLCVFCVNILFVQITFPLLLSHFFLPPFVFMSHFPRPSVCPSLSLPSLPFYCGSPWLCSICQACTFSSSDSRPFLVFKSLSLFFSLSLPFTLSLSLTLSTPSIQSTTNFLL